MDQMVGLIFAAASFYAAAVIMAIMFLERKDGKKVAKKSVGISMIMFFSGIFWSTSAELWNIKEKNVGELSFVISLLLIIGIWLSFLIVLIVKDSRQKRIISEKTVQVIMHEVQD